MTESRPIPLRVFVTVGILFVFSVALWCAVSWFREMYFDMGVGLPWGTQILIDYGRRPFFVFPVPVALSWWLLLLASWQTSVGSVYAAKFRVVSRIREIVSHLDGTDQIDEWLLQDPCEDTS